MTLRLTAVLLAGMLLLTPACLPLQTPSSTGSPNPTPAGALPWIQVYFTEPQPSSQAGTGVDLAVLPALNAARTSIQVATFDLTLPSMTEALVAAAQRGVRVQVVLDAANGAHEIKTGADPFSQGLDAVQYLESAHIPVVDAGREYGLMHNKFILVDGKILFTGSWNLSYNDTYRNNNNLLRITAPALIANYQAKFNDLFLRQNFGPLAEVRAMKPHLTIAGMEVDNYFSPADDISSRLAAALQAAQRSIRFLAFTFTDADLARIMIQRARAGVAVSGVIESRSASQGVFEELYCASLPVKLDGNPYTMHHKVIIIDDRLVITGSFNFTRTANSANDENVLIFHSPQVAAWYTAEFERVYRQGRPPAPTPRCDAP